MYKHACNVTPTWQTSTVGRDVYYWEVVGNMYNITCILSIHVITNTWTECMCMHVKHVHACDVGRGIHHWEVVGVCITVRPDYWLSMHVHVVWFCAILINHFIDVVIKA